MNLSTIFSDQVKLLCSDASTDVDAHAIVRRKPFVITENNAVERVIHLNVEGSLDDMKNGTFHATVRMDSHVVAILRLKEAISGNIIPFVGDVVAASHVDISALTENSRVKIVKVNKDGIILEKSISIAARATIRLMDLERANVFSTANCRCCGQMKKVPLFHGVPGYCKECNDGIIKPQKAEFGGLLQGLLNSGMFYEQDHAPRTFKKSDIDSISRVNGRLIINVGNEEMSAHQDWNSGTFCEILDRQPYGTPVIPNGNSFSIGNKSYRLKVMDWAKGLATKIKELRVDRNLFLSPRLHDGMFIDKECYGDQTLLHMRRMFNIAKGKQMMDKRIRNEADAIECVNKAELIMNQPDCSRKLHMIISKQLQFACDKIINANAERGDQSPNLESEIMTKIVGIMTSIQVGLENTSLAHQEQAH